MRSLRRRRAGSISSSRRHAQDVSAFDDFLLRVVNAAGYISFLTIGGTENRAWLIRIQRGFIRAEIIGYDDFVAAGGETQAKHANKMRLEMKSYVMRDYDLVNFRFKK
jgi:ribosome-binding ATPase